MLFCILKQFFHNKKYALINAREILFEEKIISPLILTLLKEI